MKKHKIALTVIIVLVALICVACVIALGTGGSYTDNDGKYKEVSGRKSYKYITNHPIFGGWGDEIITWNPSFLEKIISPLNMNYVGLFMNYNMDSVLDGINFGIQQANDDALQNLSYYSEEEKTADTGKEKTGIIYLPGETDKPFVVLFAGGAFQSVEIFVEGLPVAQRLHAMGYPVFIVKYRVGYEEGREERAAEDMDAAMTYILDHAPDLGLDTDNYAMWGFSAGAMLVHRWCQDEAYSYRTLGYEAPGMIGLVYGGMVGEFPNEENEVPVYLCMGENDSAFGEEGPAWVREYAAYLEKNGGTVLLDMIPDTEHGFGSGYGTNADGWIDRAVAFWKEAE